MDTALVLELARQALWITMLVSAPLLLAALVVGVLVGVVQAATSINEMTLSFIPKIVAIGFTLAVAGSWQVVTMTDFTRALFRRIPTLFG